jgi:hypothetical protein
MMFYFYIPEGEEKATKNSEADSFRNIKVKHTHLKMAM